MPRITVFNNQEKEVYSFPLNDLPVFIGRGEDCDFQLPDLPAFGKQLRIEWKSQERNILATRLTPDCKVVRSSTDRLGRRRGITHRLLQISSRPFGGTCAINWRQIRGGCATGAS